MVSAGGGETVKPPPTHLVASDIYSDIHDIYMDARGTQ
jgi:hypothetical protein